MKLVVKDKRHRSLRKDFLEKEGKICFWQQADVS